MKTHMGLRHPVRTQHLEVAQYMDTADLSLLSKRAIYCRALLQKMTYGDQASYGSSPLCTHSAP